MSLTLPIEIGRLYRRRDGTEWRAYQSFTPGRVTASEDLNADPRTGRLSGGREHRFDLVEGPLDEVIDTTSLDGPASTGTGHPHAAAMMEYAKDAAEHAEPWKLWEVKIAIGPCANIWRACASHPAWDDRAQYRRKPRTIRIGDRDVPEPLRVAPAAGVTCWHVHLPAHDMAEPVMFCDTDWQRRMLERGLLHATREGAMAHAEALVELSSVAP